MPSPKESNLGLVVYIFWGDFREKDLECWTIVRKATGVLARHQDPSKVSPQSPGARVVGRNEASSIVAAQNEVVAISVEAFDEVNDRCCRSIAMFVGCRDKHRVCDWLSPTESQESKRPIA
jgi:hypothetical protein